MFKGNETCSSFCQSISIEWMCRVWFYNEILNQCAHEIGRKRWETTLRIDFDRVGCQPICLVTFKGSNKLKKWTKTTKKKQKYWRLFECFCCCWKYRAFCIDSFLIKIEPFEKISTAIDRTTKTHTRF